MKKMLISAGAIALLAMPALAKSTTVEFTSEDGVAVEYTFRDDGKMVLPDGSETDYTMDEATKTICATLQDSEVCATFAELGEDIGFETAYTLKQGGGGMAAITAVED